MGIPKVAEAWGRDELLARYSEVIVAGVKPRGAPVSADPELERQRLAFDMKKWEHETQQKQQRIDLERQRLELENKKAEEDRERRLAEKEERRLKEVLDQQRHEEIVQLQREKQRREEERMNDGAAKAKRYGEAVRGSIIAMGQEPLDAIVFFRRAEQLFVDYEIPVEFQAKVVSPFLSTKAKAVLAKLDPEIVRSYADMKAAVLRELKLSANTYLERFNTCGKASDETYVSYASKLRSLLDYYLESRCVDDFAELCDLLVADRIKSTLSEGCLKYILSIESSKEKGQWLPVKDLTTCIDRFVAAKGDSVKSRANFLGQNNSFRGSRPGNFGVQGDVKHFGQTASTPKPVGTEQRNFGPHFQTPVKSVVCYECQKPGHMRSNCPKLKAVRNLCE